MVQPSGNPVPGEPFVGLSVGFSSPALKLFGLHESLQDEAFEKGQLRDAKDLGDSGTERAGIFYPDWDVEFKADIHGIFQITAHDDNIAKMFIDELPSCRFRSSSFMQMAVNISSSRRSLLSET